MDSGSALHQEGQWFDGWWDLMNLCMFSLCLGDPLVVLLSTIVSECISYLLLTATGPSAEIVTVYTCTIM